MSEIKAGDVVELKSGGPRMTVDKVIDSGMNVTVVWFCQGGIAHELIFSVAALVKSAD